MHRGSLETVRKTGFHRLAFVVGIWIVRVADIRLRDTEDANRALHDVHAGVDDAKSILPVARANHRVEAVHYLPSVDVAERPAAAWTLLRRHRLSQGFSRFTPPTSPWRAVGRYVGGLLSENGALSLGGGLTAYGALRGS